MKESRTVKFTMRLWKTHSDVLRKLSEEEDRPQSMYIRAAIHSFLNLTTKKKREKVISEYLKAHRV